MLTLCLVFVLMLALLIVRMPIAFAMGFSGVFGLLLHFGPGPALSVLDRIFFDKTSSFILVSIPLFILMAEIMTAGGTVARAVNACKAWIGHFRGGLAYAAVAASVLLAALIGSSTASSAAMSTTIYPEMKRARYDDRLSTGIISVGGTLAVMIPPSIALIFYGVLTETSIGKLFIAGVVPGLLTALGFVIAIALIGRREGAAPPTGVFSLGEAVRTSSGTIPIVALILLVIVSIYTGAASPTEAGAVGVSGALVLAILNRSARTSEMWRCVSNTIRTTVAIVAIIACSAIFSNYLTFTQITPTLLKVIEASGMPPAAIMLLVVVFLLFLGTFMDQLAILSLTMPLAFPIVSGLGYEPIWFGIIVVKTVEIGLLTPPLGLNAFIVSAQTGVPLRTVFRGLMPFLFVELVVLAILLLVPQVSLFLPAMMR